MQDINVSWVAFTAFMAAAVGMWHQIKGFLVRVFSLVIENGVCEGNAAKCLRFYAWQRFRMTPWGPKRFGAIHTHVRPLGKVTLVPFERVGTAAKVFWLGWKPLVLVSGSPNGNREGGSPDSVEYGFLKFYFLRGSFDVDTLIQGAVQAFNDHSDGTETTRTRYFVQRVIGRGSTRNRGDSNPPQSAGPMGRIDDPSEMVDSRFIGFSAADIGPSIVMRPLQTLALPDELSDVVEEALYWRKSERWFKDRGLIWSRGWLLYGEPGTGKTSLIRALAQEMDVPVFVFDLATLSNEELTCEWNIMQANAPVMAVFEDMDAVFHGRENVLGETGGGLTFDCLLNCMSGIQAADGVFKVVTTNDLSKIDPALGIPRAGESVSSRPGRLDRAIKIPNPDAACRRKIAERICSDCPEEINYLVALGEDDTAAQFTERCSQVAIAAHWNRFELKEAA